MENKKKTKWKKRRRIAGILLAAVILGVLAAFAIYVGIYYHAKDSEAAISSEEQVLVEEIKEGYFFDGPGTEKALIFYPGAKVEDIAYGSLLKELAREGMDCYLIHMPCNLAFFGKDKADEIRETSDYKEYYLAGHSLGGAMAASYLSDTTYEWDGLILLAAYAVDDLTDRDFRVLSLYGSEDTVVNREKIEEGRSLMPEDYEEISIPGGNHSQFGDYGEQKGDGVATISSEMQKHMTVEKILE